MWLETCPQGWVGIDSNLVLDLSAIARCGRAARSGGKVGCTKGGGLGFVAAKNFSKQRSVVCKSEPEAAILVDSRSDQYIWQAGAR